MQVKHDLAKFECIKYEVANSYEFYELPFVWICTNDPHLTPPPNLHVTGV